MKALLILSTFFLLEQCLAYPWDSTNNYTILCPKDGEPVCICPPNVADHSVDCTDIQLRQVPTSISFPDHVKNIIFRENNIETLTNTIFLSGRGVLTLDLSFNKIHFVAADAFGNLESLQVLDISHNQIWNLPFRAFDGLNSLVTLDLSYNKISTFFPEIFNPCVALRELRFRYNPVLFVERNSFQYLKALENLNLESTGLTTLPYGIFKNNSNLNTLILSGNSLSNVPLLGLISAKGLKSLDISENPIPTLPDGSFKGLNELEVLIANHMRRLRTIESGAFTDLQTLRELYMSDNLELTSISESAFFQLRKLMDDEGLWQGRSLLKVFLRHCGLTTLPKNLMRWDELVELDLSENPWECDCHIGWIANSLMSSKAKKSMVCASPANVGGKNVAGMAANDFTCRLLSVEGIIGLSVLVSVSFMLALGLATYFLFKKRICKCFRMRKDHHKYMRVITRREKVDLEWDHEPFVKRSET